MNKMTRFAIPVFAGLLLSSCSTLSTVGDAVSSLNPFDGSDSGQGEAVDDPNRISILELSETLVVTGAIQPSDVVLPDPVLSNDWPQVGGNASHSLQRVASDGNLEKAWSKSFGKGSSRKGRILAPPVIQGDRIYVMDAKNTVRALSTDGGSRIWEHKVKIDATGKTRRGRKSIIDRVRDPLSFRDEGGVDKDSVGGGVAIDGDVVYVTSGLGVIEALDANSGESLWRREIRVPLHSAPTVKNGRLFAISDDNELFALNASSGETLWTYQGIVESARMLTLPAPAVVDEVVIAPFSSGELVALRVQNGGVLWQDSLSGGGRLTPLASLNDIASGPVVADGYVIASAQSGAINAFDLRTGQRIWSQPAGTLSFPWVAGDFVYAATTNGEIICMSKLDGQLVWLTQLETFKNEKKRKKKIAWSGPVLVDDKVVVFSSRGVGMELNPFDGSVIREFKTGQDVFVPPVFANGTLYIVSDGAKLTAYR
jgi:outer membrane protein assembly factor BamB